MATIAQKQPVNEPAPENTPADEVQVPPPKVLEHAAKIALNEDKSIMLDYYSESMNNSAFIGQHVDTKEKILIKSAEEYTSTIQNVFKLKDHYIIVTENSIYIVSTDIKMRKIST